MTDTELPNPDHTAVAAPDFDSIVIGGGAAGLAASMVLARARSNSWAATRPSNGGRRR